MVKEAPYSLEKMHGLRNVRKNWDFKLEDKEDLEAKNMISVIKSPMGCCMEEKLSYVGWIQRAKQRLMKGR